MNLWLANSILIIHLIWVLFIVLLVPLILVGGYYSWKWTSHFYIRTLHVVMMAIVTTEALVGMACPLTILENSLRSSSGQAGYEKDFVSHWIHKVMFFDFAPWSFTIVYGFFLLIIALLWFVVPPSKKLANIG